MEIDFDLLSQSVTFYKVKVTEEIRPYLEALSDHMDEFGYEMEKLFKKYGFKIEKDDNTGRGSIGDQGFETDLNGIEWFSFIEANHDIRTSFMRQFEHYVKKEGFKISIFFQENDYRCERFFTNDISHKYFKLWCFVDGMEWYGIDEEVVDIFREHGATNKDIKSTDWGNIEDVERLADKYDVDFESYDYEYEHL